ncbi:MAG TPA: NUDIX domain-containing protein [Actinomycetota bacterium]|nr:NUDIX domain-containing protein [Actinomycetota bacterium]
MRPQDDSARFPDLFRSHERTWGSIRVNFRFSLDHPPSDLIGNVRMVPFVGDDVVVVRSEQFGPMIVGGTLEPNETPVRAIERELLEEAGAALRSFAPLGCALFHSDAPEPYRPHLPHPDWYWLIGYGDVELVSAPLNPDDGERILTVDLLTPEHAAETFREVGDGWAADLVMLAVERRRAGRR